MLVKRNYKLTLECQPIFCVLFYYYTVYTYYMLYLARVEKNYLSVFGAQNGSKKLLGKLNNSQTVIFGAHFFCLLVNITLSGVQTPYVPYRVNTVQPPSF